MKSWSVVVACILVVAALAGCGEGTGPSATGATAGEEQGTSAQHPTDSVDNPGYASPALDTSYAGALPASSQLVLGTFALEETANAVTPEQAATLLPLWRMIQGGSLQSEAETTAVLRQIEGAMTSEQIAAIAAMQLGMEDLGSWMREQGVRFAPPSDATTGGSGGFAPPNGMSEQEMAAVRATAEAGGGFPGGRGFPGGGEAPGGDGPFRDMSEEERATMRATAEAGGMPFPQGGDRAPAGGGGDQLAVMIAPVIELLTARAAE